MSEFIDDTIDTQGSVDTSTDVAVDSGSSDDSYGALQDRVAGDIDNDPWYSASEGAVVDANGNAILDPKTGQPYTSLDEMKKGAAPVDTAKPKTEAKAEVKPMSRSFESIVSKAGEVTPENLLQLSKVATDYSYKDELVPKIDPATATKQEAPVDPIQQAKETRELHKQQLIGPLDKVKAALVAQGADEALVNQLLSPIVQEQMAKIEEYYQSSYEKALQERMESKFNPKITEIEEKKLSADSDANISSLASKYYPDGGKDAFFALVNGNYNDKGEFVRGPSAEVLDLFVSAANDGKVFASDTERNKSYRDFFLKTTADPVKAKALMNVAHYYWLGKNVGKAFDKGKQTAVAENQRIQKTVKTRPASYAAPSTVDDDEGMPQMLKYAMGNRR
jgi:hypothetical protein